MPKIIAKDAELAPLMGNRFDPGIEQSPAAIEPNGSFFRTGFIDVPRKKDPVNHALRFFAARQYGRCRRGPALWHGRFITTSPVILDIARARKEFHGVEALRPALTQIAKSMVEDGDIISSA